MKIREKLFFAFGLYILLTAIFGFFALKGLSTITTKLLFVETVDDITNTVLEIRRHEKNYLLFKDSGSLKELNDYLAVFKSNIDKIKEEIIREIGTSNYDMMKNATTEYERLVNALPSGEKKDFIDKMRSSARQIQSFTEDLSKKTRMDIGKALAMSMNLLVAAFITMIAAGIIINAKLSSSIATPIRNLERVTKKISKGDFSEKVEIKRHDAIASLGIHFPHNDEIISLEISFNQMEERLKNALSSLELTIEKLQEKQAQLVEAEKLASVGRLAAGVAHEINNPLTSVLTFSNLMLEQCPKDDPRYGRLKMMVRETERARNIIRQLLNFGREIIIKPVPMNINNPVYEIVNSLMGQEAFNGIEITMNLSDNLPEISADPAQILQVVLNIMLNAIHAITPPGKIEITTRVEDKFVEMVFSDSGAGISEENLNKVFDPFFTTKEMTKGTGLGLAVSYGIIKKHGGDIEVTSTVGKGTTFIVRLPVYG